ncbi:L-serine ammonia-lyase [Zooshikella harenae]|uniref:L-serine dehydratase n=1 Tax=Zooshikella harenae TaxID=2827238 RepID=A0ABS5ZGY3_9GAMM|nr:L-serine ammonia-lyase [Zooshikella harenae]MBU2713225.1 L-serine ammonia-lyase [Zooshikella harenae]
MALSVFDLFKIGVGPSSSHTVGPMVAVNRFLESLGEDLYQVHTVKVHLYGSLALTGKGHATDTAVIMGLIGHRPERVDPQLAAQQVDEIHQQHKLLLGGIHLITFNPEQDLQFHNNEFLPAHPNGMTLLAINAEGETLKQGTYFSVGGGFVLSEDELNADNLVGEDQAIPYPFNSAQALLKQCEEHKLTIAELMMTNEIALHESERLVEERLQDIWSVMTECIERGCRTKGQLPGGLGVPRRAADIYQNLLTKPEAGLRDPLTLMDWVSLFALAVNEENAAGGRVVTAPTNGAAGVIPAVLAYYMRFVHGADLKGMYEFLLTAAAIGILYKQNASISAAEVGCQGEIGVASSMAAGALAAVLGGTVRQVENAAEIGMEHSLGMTCDPIGGLVQIPCIERNTMGAIKAINAARLAIRGDGTHRVSLDDVIKTMYETGKDMQSKYKETALGGLAVNVVIC